MPAASQDRIDFLAQRDTLADTLLLLGALTCPQCSWHGLVRDALADGEIVCPSCGFSEVAAQRER